jgi:hypothetical protein
VCWATGLSCKISPGKKKSSKKKKKKKKMRQRSRGVALLPILALLGAACAAGAEPAAAGAAVEITLGRTAQLTRSGEASGADKDAADESEFAAETLLGADAAGADDEPRTCAVRLTSAERAEAQFPELAQMRTEVRNMFDHAHGSYMKHAFPHDELMPLSCKGRSRGKTDSRGALDEVLGDYALTVVDSLSTVCGLTFLYIFLFFGRLVAGCVGEEVRVRSEPRKGEEQRSDRIFLIRAQAADTEFPSYDRRNSEPAAKYVLGYR